MPIITIDGNIGSGKSTILNLIHQKYKISIDLEPIEQWKNYLEDLYVNKNIFNFQLRVWLDRAWIQEKENKILLLMERSPFFIRNTFNQIAFDNNQITANELNILNELYSKTDNIWKANKYIYLKSDPEKCLNRIKKRGRKYECSNIDLKYLNDIHILHEKALEKAINNKMDILVIDIEDKDIDEIILLIYNYIK